MSLLADRYELRDELGRGGMARVVAGHDTLLDRPVAVKLLLADHDPTARARFLQEGRTAARVRHPAAVAVYDTGEEDGRPYLVMEYIEGVTLSDRLRRDGQLSIAEATRITAGVLEGLHAAHQAGMVHRDIKPANVFLPDAGGVKLGDFGIAKALDDTSEGLTATGAVMGTPTYLAPELVEGREASPASDLYGVGCLLYTQLAGRPPFHEGGPVAVAYAHRHQPVPPITGKRPDTPPELQEVLARSLSKEPEGRYLDAVTMRAALLGEPIDEDATRPYVPPPAAAAGPAAAGAAGSGATDAPTRTAALPQDDATTRAVGSATTPGAPREPKERRSGGGRLPWTLLALLAVAVGAWWLAGQPGLDALRTEEPVEEPDPDEVETDDPPAEDTGDDDAPAEPEETEEPEDPGEPEDPPDEDEGPPDDPPGQDNGQPDDPPGQEDGPEEGANDDDGGLVDDLLDGLDDGLTSADA